jgi:MSHA biogenesis protein MshL
MQMTIGHQDLKKQTIPAYACCLALLLALLYSQNASSQAARPEQTPGADGKSRFALSVKEVSLRELLLLLTKNSNYSLIMEAGTDAVIPVLDLKSVSLDEVLRSIMPSLGLEYRFEGNILKIRRTQMQTRLFYINYVAVTRNGKRDMNMSSRSQGGNGGGSSSASGGSGSGGSGGSNGGSSSENKSSIVTENSSAVWKDLQLGLESIIFSSEGPTSPNKEESDRPSTTASRDQAGRRLLINPQAGLIMIHAEPETLEEAGNYIGAIEGSIQRQVLIEAKVVEVTLAKDYQLGINWSAILNPTSSFTGLLSSANGVSSPSARLSTGSILNQNVNSSMGNVQYSIGNGKVGVIIDALSRQGQLRVLSSPRISTLNNQKAVIRVVREEVYFTQTSNVSQSVGPTVTTQNVENQIVPIGVVLDIIPQIANDGEITLSINPSISELVEVRSFSSNDGEAASTQPVIDRRDLDTVAKVHSGETVLIAGIMRERKSEELRGVPWLMHLPFIGNAFRRTEQSANRTELVILITPTLITGTKIKELTEEEIERLKQMERPFKLGTVEPAKEGIKNEFKR